MTSVQATDAKPPHSEYAAANNPSPIILFNRIDPSPTPIIVSRAFPPRNNTVALTGEVNNPDYFDLDNFKKIIEHAKNFKAQIFYAGVGLGNPKNLKSKPEKNQSYIINYNGLKKIE